MYLRRCHVQLQKPGAADPERGPPILKGGRSRSFLPLPGAVGRVGPIETGDFVQQSLAERTEQCQIGRDDGGRR